jgi:hypothetical protein
MRRCPVAGPDPATHVFWGMPCRLQDVHGQVQARPGRFWCFRDLLYFVLASAQDYY